MRYPTRTGRAMERAGIAASIGNLGLIKAGILGRCMLGWWKKKKKKKKKRLEIHTTLLHLV